MIPDFSTSDAPDFAQAARFLTLLDETVESWTFQTFDDNKARKATHLARVFHGTLEQHWQELCALSAAGAGVFVTVNETNGKGRKVADIVRVRAVFQECDRPGTPEPPLNAHIVVESSPGKYHRYLLVNGGTRFDLFEQVMARMVRDFGSDPNAKDRARVLRLPGFPHQKKPNHPSMVRIIQESGAQPYSWDEVTAKVPPLVIEKPTAEILPGKGVDGPAKVRSALAALSPDMEYQPWLQIGMALHHATSGGNEGFALWDEWSARGNSYRPGETAQKWSSFGSHTGNPVTLASVFKLASAEGWRWKDPAVERLEREQPPPYGEPRAAEGDASPIELPQLPRIVITLDDLLIQPPPPRFLIDGYLPKDVFALIGTGGTGKTTLWLMQCIHLILSRPLWDMEITESGPVVYVTAEDGEERLKWRLFNIVNQMGLTRSERQQIADQFHIVNLVGTGRRLAALDKEGNITVTSLADQFAEEFATIAPVLATFDPMIKFGPGERMVNDGEDALVNAAHRIKESLHCAPGYVHHVSKEVMRNGIVDHHAGRGGSALGDGARAAYQLLTITADLARNYPGAELYPDAIAAGDLLAYHITKLSDARRPPEPLILRRKGWLFDLVNMPTQKEIESAIETARRERTSHHVDTVVAYLKDNTHHKLTRRALEECYSDIGLHRNETRAAISKGLRDRVLIEADLPLDEQHGAKKTYIAVAGGAE